MSIEAWFSTLAHPDDPDTLDMESISKLFSDIDIDASSDLRALGTIWQLHPARPGMVTKEEFVNGFTKLKIFSSNQLKQQIHTFDPGFLEAAQYRDFYKFVFQFSREGTNKTLEKDYVVALLPVILDTSRAPHLNLFVQFLEQCNHTRITLDQWESFLQFNNKVKLDLSDFEDDGAWPVLLDEYVEWRRKNKIN